MRYAIFAPDGTPIAYMTASMPPTLEQIADYCAEVSGFADRDEWMEANSIDGIAFAPVH